MKVTLKTDCESEYLKHGVEYSVYAIYLTKAIEFMVFTEALPSAPYGFSSEVVEVVDNRLSRHWVYGCEMISFPEWANDKTFYEGIINGGGQGVVWRKYREKMDVEFFDNTLIFDANRLEDHWVQCGQCLNAWLHDSLDEIVTCPSCKTKQNCIVK